MPDGGHKNAGLRKAGPGVLGIGSGQGAADHPAQVFRLDRAARRSLHRGGGDHQGGFHHAAAVVLREIGRAETVRLSMAELKEFVEAAL